MKRAMMIAALAAVLAAQVGPAFAQTPNVGNCDLVAKSQWAQCIIERSQERGGE